MPAFHIVHCFARIIMEISMIEDDEERNKIFLNPLYTGQCKEDSSANFFILFNKVSAQRSKKNLSYEM